jgi:hypothetical protein
MLICFRDFVELVKTPGRNKSAVKTRSDAAINAEKLARINALHFGEFASPSKVPVAVRALPIPEVTTKTKRYVG